MKLKSWFKNTTFLQKVILAVLGIALISVAFLKLKPSNNSNPQYQTSTVSKGTLISTITASGSISSTNSLNLTTTTTGTVKKVYVKNGDLVKKGQKIAEIELDQDSKQRQASAYASYLSALNSGKSSDVNKLSLQSSLESARKSLLDAQNSFEFMNKNLSNGDNNPATKQPYTELEKLSIESAYTTAKQNFAIAEKKFNDSDSSIAASKAQLNSAWLSYQQLSSLITSPADGEIINFSLEPGVSINSSQSSTQNGSVSSQKIASIRKSTGSLQAVVNLTEIDVTKVEPGQKVTLTLDAFPDLTLTGKVLTIDTDGTVSSGVTTYPATIVLETDKTNIYPNMSVTAKIITSIDDNVFVVPSSAISTTDGQSTVQIQKNGTIESVPVTLGNSSDSDTAIISGLNEGDTVVTGITNPSSSTSKSNSTSSPFSGFGGRNFGGNQIRIMR